jgi:hypothetical protein
MSMILTNSIRRKDEQERHFCDIVVFWLVINKKNDFSFFSLILDWKKKTSYRQNRRM